MPDDNGIITSDESGFEGVTYVEYTVKSGDTLEGIATEHGISVAILIQVNNLSLDATGGSMVTVGDVLQIPVINNEPSSGTTSGTGSEGGVAATQTIRTRSTRGVTIGHPYASVSIATETGMLTLNQNLAVTSDNFDGDILSFTTARDLGQDCPTFNIRVVYRHDWYNMIGSNDLVIIYLCRPPESKGAVMFGLVDDIRRSMDFSTGNPVRSFDLTGRGMNKALVNFTVGAIAELGGIESASGLGFMGNMTDIFTGKSPAAIIQGVLQHYLTKGCNYQFADGTNFLSRYQQYIYDNPDNMEFLENSMSFLNYQGALWQLLKEIKNAPFNEMFWEIYDDKPTFVFRPTPFNEDDWTKLERIQIKDMDIISENVGRSDLETYVVYSVKATSFIGNVDISGNFPVWYKPYYSKYGLTRLQVNSKFIGTSEEGSNAVILKKQQDIFNWNIKNNSMENGTIVVKGSNRYKIGSRIILESTGIEYYVENVTHNFTYLQSWTTTLSVTRGLTPDNRFTAPWGNGVQMTPADASEIYGYDVTAYQGAVVDPSGVGGNYGGGATNVALTGQPNYDFVNVALAELGNCEANGTHIKYIKAYDASWGSGTHWCACFVSWCARQAGLSTDQVPQYAGCTTGMGWYQNRNRFQTSRAHGGSSSYIPKAGDVIFFNWEGVYNGDSDHTGIVVSCDGTTITTVEGNTSDMVAKRTYNITDPDIMGYGIITP